MQLSCEDFLEPQKLPSETELVQKYPFVQWKLVSDAHSGRQSASLTAILQRTSTETSNTDVFEGTIRQRGQAVKPQTRAGDLGCVEEHRT